MCQFSVPAARPRRSFRVALLLLLLGLLSLLAAWGWSAYHRSLAEREAAAQQYASAWRRLEQAQLTWPVRADTHLLAARIARRLGKVAQAQAHLEAHERLGGDRDDRALEQTLLHVQEGDLVGQDKNLLAMVRDNHPQSSDILEALARGYLSNNQPGGLPALLELWPDRLVTSCWRGKVHYYLGHFSEAIADLTPFVASGKNLQEPEWDELRFELAQACYRTGRVAESLRHLRRLELSAHARRDPLSPDILLGLGMCLQDQARLDEAATVLDRLLEQHPKHPAGLIERGRVAFRQGQPQQGERWARQAIEHYPTAPDGYLILALCLKAQGRHEESREPEQRWQTLDAAQYHLGQILPQLKRFPNDAQLHFEAGSMLLLLGDQKPAIEALGHALRLEPNHRSSHRLLAEYYQGLGELERAQEHRRAARRQPAVP